MLPRYKFISDLNLRLRIICRNFSVFLDRYIMHDRCQDWQRNESDWVTHIICLSIYFTAGS